MRELSSCFFPATVVAVDDNVQLLTMLKLNIERHLPCKTFEEPSQALNFLKSLPLPDFVDRCVRHINGNFHTQFIDIDISEIHREIYEQNRFSHVSVVVIDYEMPGMNGAEFCRQLEGSPYKIILLTGKADVDTAIELFNEGIIHRYIHKSDPNHLDILLKMIYELQLSYFNDLSSVIVRSIARKTEAMHGLPSCLEDPLFISFFEKFFKSHPYKEYYLLDASGSFLFLEESGEPRFLVVKHVRDMESAETLLAQAQNLLPPQMYQAILQRETLIHRFDPKAALHTLEDWQKVIYPAEKLEGRHETYYYSDIQTPLQATGIDLERISSYAEYLKRNA